MSYIKMLSLYIFASNFFVFALASIENYAPGSPNDVTNEGPLPPKHHKVHNLILYPDKHSWCELKKIRQIVTHANCDPLEMENYVCVGTCFSYSVPKTEPTTPGDEMLDYCDSCQPAESRWTTIALNCEVDGKVYIVTKNIQLITNCSCTACKSPPKVSQTNDFYQNNHHISELIYKMLPENHPLSEDKVSLEDPTKYSQMSLGDLKKEVHLDPTKEKLIKGKLLIMDVASFKDTEETNGPSEGALP